MKFRRLVSLFIIAIIVIAFFTNPKEAGFTRFMQPRLSRVNSGPLIQYKNNLLYSVAEVTYFNPSTENGKLVASASKEKYIGLFGRFWKVSN